MGIVCGVYRQASGIMGLCHVRGLGSVGFDVEVRHGFALTSHSAGENLDKWWNQNRQTRCCIIFILENGLLINIDFKIMYILN